MSRNNTYTRNRNYQYFSSGISSNVIAQAFLSGCPHSSSDLSDSSSGEENEGDEGEDEDMLDSEDIEEDTGDTIIESVEIDPVEAPAFAIPVSQWLYCLFIFSYTN